MNPNQTDDVIAGYRSAVEQLNKEMESIRRGCDIRDANMHLCRKIAKCPEDDTLAVWLEDQQSRITQLFLERDRWQAKAEEKIALRREIETALGIETGDTNDEALSKGVKALRCMVRLDAPVVTGLVNALVDYERIYGGGHGRCPEAREALSAYEARVKSVEPERQNHGHLEIDHKYNNETTTMSSVRVKGVEK